MPELQFKGKEFVFNHHLTVPFRPLLPDATKSVGEPSLGGNLIIHGDNLHALKALLPMYAGKVDCIFIDPPYNTGNEGWSYNDNVNSPMMKEWLSSNPINGDDMLRHDKWCAMIWPRLVLLHQLLAENGVFFVSIDDNELYHLRLCLDEIFGENHWVGTIVWRNVTDNNPTNISSEHEYILCFARSKSLLPKEWSSSVSEVKDKLIEIGKEIVGTHRNPAKRQKHYSQWLALNKPHLWPFQDYKFIDDEGIYTGSRSVHNPGKEGYRYDVPHPTTGLPCKQPLMGYRFPQETMTALLTQKKILFGKDETKIIELKVYVQDFQDKLPSVITLDGRAGANELRALFPDDTKQFDHPKPVDLIMTLLSFVTRKDSLILDSFAGSGTTGHATLSLNSRDTGHRRFIMIETEDYADSLTAERMKRVAVGVSSSEDPTIRNGLGGEFTYCNLGEPLNLDKMLTGESLPDFFTLGSWLFHTATGEVFLPDKANEETMFLGESSAYYCWLVYKSDLPFLKSSEAALTLSLAERIAASKPKGKKHLVFAPAKYAPNSRLLPMGVEYAPLPFALYRIEKG